MLGRDDSPPYIKAESAYFTVVLRQKCVSELSEMDCGTTVEEAKELIERGYSYEGEIDGVKLFKKIK
jgi:hypothetical protein